MKIGVKIVCKKYYKFIDIEFIKNKTYTIESIEFEQGIKFYCIDGIFFAHLSPVSYGHLLIYFDEFFILQSEERKLKLEKLNEIK